MVQVKVRPGETLEAALRRFNRMVQEAGIIDEIKERQYFEKPSVKKTRKEKERRATVKRITRRNR